MEKQVKPGIVRRKVIELLPLILTAIIAVAACLSTYYSYKSIKIASELKGIQSRQEIFGYIKDFLEMATEYSGKKQPNTEDSSASPSTGR